MFDQSRLASQLSTLHRKPFDPTRLPFNAVTFAKDAKSVTITISFVAGTGNVVGRKAVMVESFVSGNDYRVLVIGGHMIAVAQRIPAHVVGDGEHTVRELVEITTATAMNVPSGVNNPAYRDPLSAPVSRP